MSRSTLASQSLPERPHMGVLKKLAKTRLLSLRQTDPAARLCDAQLTVAREYGFPSWRKLRAHVDAQQAADDRPAKVLTLTLVSIPLVPADKAANLASMYKVLNDAPHADLFRTRAMDLDAHVAAAFGHDPEATGQVLASMAAAPSGRLLATRTRPASAMRLTTIRLPLTSPTHRWGHPRDRMAILPPPTP